MSKKTAIIIGAGPAGLTAAFELLKRSDIQPVIFESTDIVGGIARTIDYKGNRIDMGGHRFFSKSARVTNWWLSLFPLQKITKPEKESVKKILGDAMNESVNLDSGPDPKMTDQVMLVRKRLSRIFFHRQFFDYPLSFSFSLIHNLGYKNSARIIISYLKTKIFPIKTETSLEDFFINRFGRELYTIFFKNYTEKVWGMPCTAIKPDWGSQRVKGLSMAKVVGQAFTTLIYKKIGHQQKKIETSLVDYYLYPKFGPGQMWEEVATLLQKNGVKIYFQHTVIGFDVDDKRITNVKVREEITGNLLTIDADYVLSTMPVRDLVLGIHGNVPTDVRLTAQQLQYRDFITVGLLYARLKTPNGTLPDNWIYVQESDVKIGRIQVFNNWSPYLIRNPEYTWLGLEYFCQEGDDLWTMTNSDLINLGIQELTKLDLAESKDFLDGVVLRMPKAYPAYFGGYERFHIIREYIDRFNNLFLIGRNGMHRYNNMDHSMLAAMTAVDNIIGNITTKDNLWKVNTEVDYHEEK